MDLVSRAVRNEEYLRRLAIPARFWDFIRDSWTRGDPHLYGRMDLGYDGRGRGKLYELNYEHADLPVRGGGLPVGVAAGMHRARSTARRTDQFNSLQEKLLLAFESPAPHLSGLMHFASVRESQEDRATVEYLEDLATQAGIRTQYLPIEDIGRTATAVSPTATTASSRRSSSYIRGVPAGRRIRPVSAHIGRTWFEPPWKLILSKQGRPGAFFGSCTRGIRTCCYVLSNRNRRRRLPYPPVGSQAAIFPRRRERRAGDRRR